MHVGGRKILIFVAVFLGGLFAGIALVIFLQAKPEPAPDTSKLKDLLHNTAQREIGLPPLADVEVELTIDRAKLDQEIERIKALAAKFGGTAIQGTGDDTGTEVMAEISPRFTGQFLEALKHPEKQPVADLQAEDNENALVQVRLKFQS
ncbi:MAG: hypothetical protein JO279_09775 [Verrucomicrobia bacterium]|nr:hypothetical protein [Verrucomicrobiota bacterium]